MTPFPLLLLAATAAVSLSGCQKAQDEAFGERVRAYLIANPEVLEETVNALEKKKQADVAKASTAALSKHRAQLERDPRDFVANPNGQVTVVQFFDYNCGYCKLIAPEVVKLVRENPDVRFVFKEYAFQSDSSVQAASLALTPQGKSKGLALYEALMSQKPLNQDTIARSLVSAGVDAAAAGRAAQDPAIERQLLDTHALAQAINANGTPTFIIGDTIIPGADPQALRAAILQAKTKDLKRPGSPT